jgi:hypothetical protein
MRDFCYPDTGILDPAAVQTANDYICFNRDSGKIIGIEVPLPTGPYSQAIDPESSNNYKKESFMLK